MQVKAFNAATTKYEFLRKYDSRLNRFSTVEARLLVYPQILASIDEELQKATTYWGSTEEYINSKTQSAKAPTKTKLLRCLKKLWETANLVLEKIVQN